jgi:hypothetical protein
MDMTTATQPVVTVVDIGGRMVLGKDGATVRSLVFELVSHGDKKILFDLADASYRLRRLGTGESETVLRAGFLPGGGGSFAV